jgi:hypothetical protein
MADMLKRQERDGGRTRHWRSNFKRLQRDLLQIEEDEQTLDSVFPQVRAHLLQAASSPPRTRQRTGTQRSSPTIVAPSRDAPGR